MVAVQRLGEQPERDLRGVVALRGLSFVIERGAFVGILGPSGGGKSTLLKCLYRTYLASHGAIGYERADGATICSASLAA